MTRKNPSQRYTLVALVISVVLASESACAPPVRSETAALHRTLSGGAYTFYLTDGGTRYDFTLQTLNDNVGEPYTDGFMAGMVATGETVRAFILANENTGVVAIWAAWDEAATPGSVTYFDPNDGGETGHFEISEQSQSLWLMRTPEGGRIDLSREEGTVASVSFTPASEIGRVKAILDEGVYEFFRQELDGDLQYTSNGISNQSTNHIWGRLPGADEFLIANRHDGRAVYRMYLLRGAPGVMRFIDPDDPEEIIMDSEVVQETGYVVFKTPASGDFYFLGSSWDDITDAGLFNENLP